MSLHPDVQKFASLLGEIEGSLGKHAQQDWAERVALCRACVERSDAYGVHRFLSFFGGMGSLNDILLSRDGSLLKAENDQLRALLTRACELANELVRDATA